MRQIYAGTQKFRLIISVLSDALKWNPSTKAQELTLGGWHQWSNDLKGQVSFLQETGILPCEQKCTDCNKVLTKQGNKGYFAYYRCGTCKKRVSIRDGTILSGAKLSFRLFILLVHAFCQFNWTYAQTQQEACVTSDDEDPNDASGTQVSPSSI